MLSWLYHGHDIFSTPSPERFIQQSMPLISVFIDFSQASDTASRKGLGQVLGKFGCLEKLINLTIFLHDGMPVNVSYGNAYSKDFFCLNNC